MTLHPETGNPTFAAVDILNNSRIVELFDGDGDGSADNNSEQRTRYRSDTSATGVAWDPNNATDIEAAPDGSLWLLDNAAKTILRFVDLNGDGDYQEADEAMVVYDAPTAAANATTRTAKMPHPTAVAPLLLASWANRVVISIWVSVLPRRQRSWGPRLPGRWCSRPEEGLG